MQLTNNFSLEELCVTSTGIKNVPNEEQTKNLDKLAENVLQPIRDRFRTSIHIISGYRSPACNKAVGGAKNSDHLKGMASDIDQPSYSRVTNKMIFDYIKENLEFRQLINEFDYSWIHVSYDENDNKGEVLKAVKKNGKTIYQKVL
jgi:zinc D-Ala-D-Ala carboxypeptidase